MARLLQVKGYNRIMNNQQSWTLMFTLGNGSMADEPRSNGWVVFENPKLGDKNDFARWFKNKHEALMEMETRA